MFDYLVTLASEAGELMVGKVQAESMADAVGAAEAVARRIGMVAVGVSVVREPSPGHCDCPVCATRRRNSH